MNKKIAISEEVLRKSFKVRISVSKVFEKTYMNRLQKTDTLNTTKMQKCLQKIGREELLDFLQLSSKSKYKDPHREMSHTQEGQNIRMTSSILQ